MLGAVLVTGCLLLSACGGASSYAGLSKAEAKLAASRALGETLSSDVPIRTKTDVQWRFVKDTQSDGTKAWLATYYYGLADLESRSDDPAEIFDYSCEVWVWRSSAKSTEASYEVGDCDG
jgi:hypothetical protein